MAKIVSVHSFRGGTGKSNTTANMASILAAQGKRVGVVDTDVVSPGIHVLFGLQEQDLTRALNDYIWGRCNITETAQDVTARLGTPVSGRVFLVPSSTKANEIARLLREGYDAGLLNDGFQELVQQLKLDVLLLDTHPGLNDETLLSIAVSDALAVVMRPDQQDYQGTIVTLDVARQFDVPRTMLIVNKIPSILDMQQLRQYVEKVYGTPVAGMLPHTDELMFLGSAGIFAVKYPNHPATAIFQEIAQRLTG